MTSARSADGPPDRAADAVPPFRPGLLHEQEVFEQLTLVEPDLAGCRFVDCRFAASTITGGDGARSSWRGVTVRGVRFSGTGLSRSNWLDARLEGCALSGVELYGSQWRRVRLEGCLLDSVNLRGATLRDVVLDDCTLRHLDLGTAKLSDVTFRDCLIERLDLTEAQLARVDLRGSRLDIARGIDRLRGAVVDPGQLLDLAPALAVHLGLRIEPLEPTA